MNSLGSERIIFVPFVDAFGGVERLALNLSGFLNAQSLPHSLVCFRQSIDLQQYVDWPLRVHQLLPKRNPLSEARALSGFLRAARSEKTNYPLLFDLKSAFYSGLSASGPFFLHLTDPPSLLPADISKHAPAVRRQMSKATAQPRPTPLQSVRGGLVHRLNRRGVKRATKTIVMTEKIRSELRSLYGIEAVVVRPGVSDKGLVRSDRTATGPIRILSVSRLEQNKRIDWILRALAQLGHRAADQQAEWQFEIVGQGPNRDSLIRLADELGLQSRVLFRGHLSGQELEDSYARANLFLMPAVQGYGLPALEALRRGIPAIVHKDSGVSEILTNTPWVEIVEGSNGQLADAISLMLQRLNRGTLSAATIPHVPASEEWAAAICKTCDWL